MPLAHQGETTVTGAGKTITNHYVSLAACEISPAGATGGKKKKKKSLQAVGSIQIAERTDLCMSGPTNCKKTIRQADSIHLLTLDRAAQQGGN